MKVLVNINVRNPEWYLSEEEKKAWGNYREEWEALNKDKVYKHMPTYAYEVPFEVSEIKENRNTEEELEFHIVHHPTSKKTIKIDNITKVTFIGEEQNAKIIISNSLIHSYLGAKKNKGKCYLYFYIKENTVYENFSDWIWLSEDHIKIIQQKLI